MKDFNFNYQYRNCVSKKAFCLGEVSKDVVANMHNVTFLDFPLTDEAFRDFEHLNHVGANKLSRCLKTDC